MIELPIYQPSEFERNAFSHYKGTVSSKLEQKLRGATMVLHNILPELYSKGVGLRIVPRGTNLTDLPECIDLKVYKTEEGKNKYDESLGIWLLSERLMVVKEEALKEKSLNQKYPHIIHEVAHAIWDIVLSPEERGYVNHLYEEEVKLKGAVGYRLSNTLEFFAYSFQYYTTPQYRGSTIFNPMGNSPIIHPGKEDLARLNLKMFTFLQDKFGNIIDPKLVAVRRKIVDPIKMHVPFKAGTTVVKADETDKDFSGSLL